MVLFLVTVFCTFISFFCKVGFQVPAGDAVTQFLLDIRKVAKKVLTNKIESSCCGQVFTLTNPEIVNYMGPHKKAQTGKIS